MTERRPVATGRIFISYRREDTAYPAGWLFDRLVDRLGAEQVFKDVDSIELGDDFVQVITDAVGATDVLLAVIGGSWLTVVDERGRRRLDDPDDFVRLEIEAALTRGVRVIPILVEGASMPRQEELPASLAPLARRHALELSPSRFTFDTSRLFRAIEKTLAEVRTAETGPVKPSRPTRKRWERLVPKALAARSSQEQGERRAWRRQRLLLAGAGLAAAAAVTVIVFVLLDSDPASESDGIAFTDDFSSNAQGWTTDPEGGSFEDGVFRVDWERAEDRWGVMATPSLSSSAPQNLRLEVNARRSGGDATEAWGYGLFCRATDPDNLYAFVIRWFHTRVEKRADGEYSYPKHANDGTVRTQAPADPESRTLRATCVDRGDDAVELSFWVDDKLIGRWMDSDDPHRDGSFGLLTTLAQSEGEFGDSLEVEFDDFAVSEEPAVAK